MTTTLLVILTIGLIMAYTVLVYNIRKYYYQHMKTELRRLSILFAAFIISYFIRLIYEVLLFYGFYSSFVKRIYPRGVLIILMPLVWDLTSILAILVLHFISFRKSQTKKDRMPEAGHFNPEGGIPNVRNIVFDESEEKTSDSRSSFLVINMDILEESESEDSTSRYSEKSSHDSL